MELTSKQKPNNQGFALLISLIVVGVVISVGLSILDLSITQVRLSDNAKQSELAFQAASAGVECGRYWRRVESERMLNGVILRAPSEDQVSCFGVDLYDDPDNGTMVIRTLDGAGETSGDGVAHFYQYSFDWSGSESRCSNITTIVMDADVGPSNLTVNNMQNYIAGFPTQTGACPGGSQCTILSVKGYNKGCADIDSFGTTEREVLIQF